MDRRTRPVEPRTGGLWILIIALSVEKILQHGLSALFFSVDVPGVGIPDIGGRFAVSAPAMAVLNVAYMALFVAALWAFVKRPPAGLRLLMSLAALDILLEFLFHHFFFITVSVLVSTALLVAGWRYRRGVAVAAYTSR